MYTKGEWRIEGDCYIIAGEKHKNSLIADIATANDDYEANAQLISQAPKMYEALKEMAEYIKTMDDIGKPHLTALKRTGAEALAKANGGNDVRHIS